jgi:hypothetical protein
METALSNRFSGVVRCEIYCRGLFEPAQPAAEAVICTMTGSGTTLKGGTIALEQHHCIVLDTSCSGVQFHGITFQGMLGLLTRSVRNSSSSGIWHYC